MKPRRTIVCSLVLLCLSGAAGAQALGTAFTYQGRLTDGGQPASGFYDLQACLYDVASGAATPVGCANVLDDVPVENGVFTVTLDFGSTAFIGQQRWLELRVRPGASTGAYTPLAPRQLVRPTPEALRANAAAAAPWSGLTGVPAGFADGVDDVGSGTVTSVTAGAGLTGGTITGAGTIGIANGGVGSAQIATGAVGSAQLADGSVAAADVAPNGLGAGQLADNAVAAAELADNAVDSAAVQDLSITQAKIAAGAVGSAQLAAGAVGTAQLAAGAVGLAQINPAQVQARITGACPAGEYLRGINADGSVACEPVPGAMRITVVDDPAAASVGRFHDIAIGFDGRPVISYYDETAGALKVARCANAACTGTATITTVDDSANDVGRHNAIAVGPDGLPVISYQDATAGRLKVAKCADAACAGPATITLVPTEFSGPANNTGAHSAIAIGANGFPSINYFDGGDYALAICANAACTSLAQRRFWNTNLQDSSLLGTSLAIAGDGSPAASFLVWDGTPLLNFYDCVDVTCTALPNFLNVGGPSESIGWSNSIAIGSDGFPVISHVKRPGGSFTGVAASSLELVKCGSASCSPFQRVTLDSISHEDGMTTSIAAGVDGVPVVSYHDRAIGALKVARCANAGCTGTPTVTVVDDPANAVGFRSSLAIGHDGLPVIAYWDSTAGALKVAKCGTRSCQ